MESFLATLPPYVHQYINKSPPTECFNVLKDLICFAVLYSNDRERINLLSLELLQKGADGAVIHKPYTYSKATLSSPSLSPSTAITSPIHSSHYLSPASAASKTIPSPSLSATKQHSEQLDLECRTIIEEQGIYDGGTIATHDTMDETASLRSAPLPAAVDTDRKSTMPYTFPDWWAHPDSRSNDVGKNISRSESPLSSNEHQVSYNTSKRLTTTQEMNITNWIPIDFADNAKSNRNQNTSRPASLYNPTIPDLRSYLGRTEQTETKKLQALQAHGSTKVARQMSVPAASVCDSSSIAIAPTLSKPRQTIPISRSPPPRLLTRSISSKTTTTSSAVNNSKPSGTSIPLSRSSSTRSTASSSSSSNKAYRPGQTATVRARAEQAKQRQLQLEEDKRKQVAASTLTSRTSLRLRQQAASGIDWESIKQDRRKTMPANGL